MDWRTNAGYIITNQIAIGESEIVLGVHQTRPNMFVTWECDNKTNYYWGHYHTNLLDAQKDFCKRGMEKAELYKTIETDKATHTEKPRKSEPER